MPGRFTAPPGEGRALTPQLCPTAFCWAQAQIHPKGLPHAALLRALMVFTAQHMAERPAALRLLANVLAPPMRAGR